MKKFEELMSVRSEIENITAEEAKQKLNDSNVQFIDVRDKESFSKGTIGNAIHMDRGLLEFYLAEGSPLENDMFKNNPDKEYVVFCGVGGQGTLATKTMKDMGVKNVKNITGGNIFYFITHTHQIIKFFHISPINLYCSLFNW